MEFSSFFFHLLFFGQIFQLSNAIVSSTKVKIPAEDAPINKLDSLTEQIPSFDSFERTFNKSYPTDVDRMAHMKYYLVRALKTFRSIMRYRKHESTYMKINEMSDWSPAEVKQLFMSHDTHEKVKPAANELTDIDVDDVDDEEGEDENNAHIGKRLVQQRIKRDNEDEVYIDHRESGCLDEPRGQGNCGACYAFATIALYEWVNCIKTGRLEAFSEQYVIDCSHRYGNNGCGGGDPVKVSNFVTNCGLDLRENYPYIGRQEYCPYDDSTDTGIMGYWRVKEAGLGSIKVEDLAEILKYAPLIATIQHSSDFLFYCRGVDDNVGHTPELLHSMLLIGHGRENGKEYWLFRNSFSTTFGEDGHYKLNKNVDCFVDGNALVPLALYKDENLTIPEFVESKNPFYPYGKRNSDI